MPDGKIVNWPLALQQVDGDIEFLKEVLCDLIVELRSAEINMNYGIKTMNFSRIAVDAHKIKGSSAYLHCDKILRCARRIQILSNVGEDKRIIGETEEKLAEYIGLIEVEFDKYKSSLLELRNEIKSDRLTDEHNDYLVKQSILKRWK